MDQTTISTQVDDGPTGIANRPGTAHHTRCRVLLVMEAAAILAAGAGVGAFVSRSDPFAIRAKPTTSTFSGATDTVIKGDLQGQTSVFGILRYSDSHKFKSGFEGVLIQVPALGVVLTQSDVLYRTDSETAYLMRGNLPAWRSFETGMEDDEDIHQLETALRDLGYFDYEPDDHLSQATISAILKQQKDFDLSRTGTLPLRRIVFTPRDLCVGTVTVRVGDRVVADIELSGVTSITQVVDADIKFSDQKLAVAGTAVTIKLPDAKKAIGRITFVGTPTEKFSGPGSGVGFGFGSGESKERVIPITVTLTDTSVTTSFQRVSVTVDLSSEKRMGVLSVPVGAPLALSANQYGVGIAEAGGITRKAPVTIGLPVGGRAGTSGQDISEGQ